MRGGFRATRGGFRATRGGLRATRGGLRAMRGGFGAMRGGFGAMRGGFRAMRIRAARAQHTNTLLVKWVGWSRKDAENGPQHETYRPHVKVCST
eukprot:1176960-Prorocentrum_minimum.AAC.1